MDRIELELPVLGVQVLDGIARCGSSKRYQGVSWCDAVRRATYGEDLMVGPGSIDTCRWSPIILGLKEPDNEFEKSLDPRLDGDVAGVRVAPLWRIDGTPDVLIVRGRPAQLRELADRLGDGALTTRYSGQIGRSATGLADRGLSARVSLSRASNRALAVLKRWKSFDRATRAAFRGYGVTSLFEKVAKNAVADMSMCRNSVAIPHIEDCGNLSFFCAGGITWGGNSPLDMTSGYPGRMAGRILEQVEFPGKAC